MKRDEYKYPIRESAVDPARLIDGKLFFVEHEPRIVSSIYFDFPGLKLYRQSEEGLTPRQKVRLRWYGEQLSGNLDDLNLEIKTTAPHHRSKESLIFSSAKSSVRTSIKTVIHQMETQALRAQSFVQYQRRYYASTDGCRVTVDSQIKYGLPQLDERGNFECRIVVAEPMSVIEVKPLHSQLLEDLPLKIRLTRARFSKYCRSIDQIFFR